MDTVPDYPRPIGHTPTVTLAAPRAERYHGRCERTTGVERRTRLDGATPRTESRDGFGPWCEDLISGEEIREQGRAGCTPKVSSARKGAREPLGSPQTVWIYGGEDHG